MRYQLLDNIVRSALMQKSYPLHYYIQGLKSASDCLRELTFDYLRNVNTIQLPIDTTGVADLPCDYVDFVKIGVPVSQYIRPIVQKQSINRLQNLDNTGNPIVYGDAVLMDNSIFSPSIINSLAWFNGTISDNGEPLGRMYGYNAGNIQDGFKIIRERGQIQLDQNIDANFVVLEYISDGQSSDNATQVHPYAQKTIEAYILWQFKEHNRSYSMGERQAAQMEFNAQRRILRARLNDLTKDDYQRIVRKSLTGTIKG